ncbi:MAG: bacteriohemerythrin [Alphaproteobacteria bacterium]|nr:bacteriohemerythrin [Alphaproteobacteria bacterium]
MDESPRLAIDFCSSQSGSEQAPSLCSDPPDSRLHWDESLVTGHAGIDNDHRYLYHLVDDYEKAIETEQGNAVAGQVLCDLATYAAGHFEREEALMRRIRFPEADAHRAEHDRFLASLGELVTAYEIGSPGVPGDILAFVRCWLTDHLVGWDRRLVAFLTAHRQQERQAG